MSGSSKKKFLCISDGEFVTIIDKLRKGDLSDLDKDLIAEIMMNHRHIIFGLLNGTLSGKDLEKEIQNLGRRFIFNKKEEVSEDNAEKDNCVKDEIKPENKKEKKPGTISPKKKHKKKKQKTKKPGKRGYNVFNTTEEKKHYFDPDFIKSTYCPCCSESSKLYPITPSVTVLFSGVCPLTPEAHIVEKARCRSCGVTIQAQVPVEVENSVGRFLPNAVAQMAIMRFGLGFPHHRMENLVNLYETNIPDANQWSAIESAAMEMEALFTCLTHNAANAKWIGIDDAYTRVVELKKEIQSELAVSENKKQVRTGIQSTVFVAKTYSDHNIALYMTGRNHQGENKAALIELRTNINPVIIMTDAAHKALMNINSNSAAVIMSTNCLEHFRIRIEEIEKHYPFETKYLLKEISKVYKNDSYCKENSLTDHGRQAYHQSHSSGIMEGIKSFIQKELKENSRAEPNGDYAKKVLNYALNNWERLIGFLKYAGAELDNNVTEIKTKTIVRYRENSKKYLTEHGASIGDFYMSLIETCKLNNINPLVYLEFCITHRELIEDDPELFLPWNYKETKKEIDEELKKRPRYKIVSQKGAYLPKEDVIHPQ